MQLDGDLIRRHRATMGLTQVQLATRSGYDTRTIQRAEAGASVLNQAAATIAQALEVRLDQIIPRQESLFDQAQSTSSAEVILLPCHSGKDLYRHIAQTDLLNVEQDFEPRAAHREGAKRLGAFIDTLWDDPFERWERHDPPSQEHVFELMIQAGEILEMLGQHGLRVLLGSYQILIQKIHYGEFGDPYIPYDSPYDTTYSKLIVCVTDVLDDTQRRTPEDHHLYIPF